MATSYLMEAAYLVEVVSFHSVEVLEAASCPEEELSSWEVVLALALDLSSAFQGHPCQLLCLVQQVLLVLIASLVQLA